MARSRYVNALLDTVAVDGEWEAGWPDAAESRANWLAGVLMVAGVIVDLGWIWYLGQCPLPVGTAAVGDAQRQVDAAIDAGLAVERGGFRRFYEWSHFDGYSRTADALVCHRPCRVGFRFALTALDDPAAVERALGRYLPRTEVASV